MYRIENIVLIVCAHTYVMCSFVHKSLYVYNHTRSCPIQVLCKRLCSGMGLSNMGYL